MNKVPLKIESISWPHRILNAFSAAIGNFINALMLLLMIPVVFGRNLLMNKALVPDEAAMKGGGGESDLNPFSSMFDDREPWKKAHDEEYGGQD